MAAILDSGHVTISDLLSLDISDIETLDLAYVNLLCATGLPGAEDLDIDACLNRLRAWATRAGRMIDSHFHVYQQNPAAFDNSEPIWRMLALARFLKNECRISYHMDRAFSEPDWTDSRDLFLHGLLGPQRHGTCVSLPVLLTSVSRRLDYPVGLSHAPGHIFSRWDAMNHKKSSYRGRFNIEFSGDIDFFPDEHYFDFPVRWPKTMRDRYLAGDRDFEYLHTFARAQEVAHCFSQRGVCLEANDRLYEAVNCFHAADRFDSRYKGYAQFAKRALRARAEIVMRTMGLEPNLFRSWLAQAGILMPATMPQPKPPSFNHGKAPTNITDIAHAVLHQTCADTAAKPTIDLLNPNPPEPKVDPYASLRDPDGTVQLHPAS